MTIKDAEFISEATIRFTEELESRGYRGITTEQFKDFM